MSRAPLLALAFVLTLAFGPLAPPTIAQADGAAAPPDGAQRFPLADGSFYAIWFGESATEAATNVTRGENVSVWFGHGGANATRVANVSVQINLVGGSASQVPSERLVIEAPNGTFAAKSRTFPSSFWEPMSLPDGVTPPANATASFIGQLYEEQNGTLVDVIGIMLSAQVPIASVEVPVAPPTDRTPIYVGLGALVVVAAVVGGFAARQRSIKRKMNEGPRRSQVMRDVELEKKLEKAKTKDPEQAVVIQQEIRQAEQVREKRREVQILEAKRADALKTLDLLRKRHETGGLTKLQYDNMAAKKQADLERIEAEIAQMEREDSGAAA